MHAYAIFLHRNEEEDDQINAQLIYDTDPRLLVAGSIREPAKGLISALKRCEPVVHSMAFYTTLNLLLKTEIATDLLGCQQIDLNVLQFFNLARRWNLDPLVIAAHRSLKHRIKHATAFHDIIQVLRALNVLHDDATERRVLRNWKRHLFHYIDARLQRVVSPLAFDLQPPLFQIRGGKQLKRLGREFKNCLGVLAHRLHLGSGNRLLVHLDEPHADHPQGVVAVLEWGPGGIWYIVEAEHARGVEASRSVLERLVELLAASGVNARCRTFSHAMRFFSDAPELATWEPFRPPQ